jgi:hypothetical protein
MSERPAVMRPPSWNEPEDGVQSGDPYPASLLLEPDWRLLDYRVPHSDSDTRRMQERAHYGWHRDHPDCSCERPGVPQLADGMGFWEALRA